MALPVRPFLSDEGFFGTVRQVMNDRGFFAGRDGIWRYVCADATFYRLGLLIRPSHLTFLAAARIQPPDVRAVINGQFFGTYRHFEPGPVGWQGEVIKDGQVLPGDPPSKPKHRYFGQWSGTSVASYAAGQGDPSSAAPLFRNAAGFLLPLISKGRKATVKQFGEMPSQYAKPVYGICRSENIIFFLAQKYSTLNGWTLPDLVDHLAAMDVDEAVLGDSASSTTLLVDGEVQVEPDKRLRKNYSIPIGLTLRLTSLELTGARRLTVTGVGGGIPPVFAAGRRLANTEGTIRLTVPGAMLVIDNLCELSGLGNVQRAVISGLPMPMILGSPASDLTRSVRFTGTNAVADLRLIPYKEGNSAITGRLTVATPIGSLAMDVEWEVRVTGGV